MKTARKRQTLPSEPVEPAGPVRLERMNEDPTSAFIARLMDTMFVIPGTNIRFGLDALIGLFPGLGDAAGAIISTAIIASAAKRGTPPIVLARMAANVFVNTAVGSVPVIGDVFSVFFRSNVKNYALLQKHAGQQRVSTFREWFFVSGVVLSMAVLLTLLILGAVTAVNYLWKAGR